MTTVLWVAAIWLPVAFAAAPRVGKALHRAQHRNGVADPADCPPWCVRERAAALLRNLPSPSKDPR